MAIRSTTLADLPSVTGQLAKSAGVNRQATNFLLTYRIADVDPRDTSDTSVIEELAVLTSPQHFFDKQVTAQIVAAARIALAARGAKKGTVLLLAYGGGLSEIPVSVSGEGTPAAE